MYSIVLLAALTTGGATPDWCHRCGCYSCGWCHGCYCGCHGCHWCHGCYSWCHGCYCGCYGCHYYSYGCYCWSCSCGCYGSPFVSPPYIYVTPATPVTTTPPPGGDSKPKPPAGTGKSESVRATLTVEVPADAVLYIDDVRMKSTSERRTFVTPPLEPGQSYYYDLRAEFTRNGQTVTVNRRVIIRPGETVTTALNETTPSTTATAQAGR